MMACFPNASRGPDVTCVRPRQCELLLVRCASLLFDFNPDLFRLGGFLFGQLYREDAILIVRRNFLRVHGVWYGKAPNETAIAALDTMVSLGGRVFFKPPLAFDRQRLILDPHVDIFQP